MALNYRQMRFIDEYLASPANAAEAARKAGYSHRRAKVTACELLKKFEVVRTIQKERLLQQSVLSDKKKFATKAFIQIIKDPDSKVGDKIIATKELAKLYDLYTVH